MNNKFLCRGKREDNQKWVEGYYVEMPVGEEEPLYLIIGLDGQYNRVILETVERCTAMNDCNGKKIFEGDIVHCISRLDQASMVVIFECGQFRMILAEHYSNHQENCHYYDIQNFEKEIIGNIHDNPELIGGDDND